MTDNIDDWRKIAEILHDALPEIDKALSQANFPISIRPSKAFDIVRETMLEVSDYKAFLVSEAHGRFLVIIGDWYRDRYGAAVDADDDGGFVAVLLIHETPFEMRVPKSFKTDADEPVMVWVGFPASVQTEEDPLDWIENDGVPKRLVTAEREQLRREATEIANLVRSIGFDLRVLEHDGDKNVADLAGAIGSDLQASARHLCERSEAGLRSAGWDASQATEKALKLYIRCKGQKPPHTHDLKKLAERVEALGGPSFNQTDLGCIPSKSDATNMRYGGQMTLSAAVMSYMAAMSIVGDLLFAAKPDSKHNNIREARFKVQRPPWFDFDTDAFSKKLHEITQKSDDG